MPKYKIADLVFEANTVYEYSHKLCEEYKYGGDLPAQFSITTTREDILSEQAKTTDPCPDPYAESLALFRKFCDKALEISDTIIFHSSAVAIDGQAYLFTAPSGTGKSTHTKLWRELFKDKAVMINDDKPMIRYIDGEFYVYGTPWNGKHRIGGNTKAKVKAICKLERAKENHIGKCATPEMLLTVLNQTTRPTDMEQMDKMLSIVGRLLGQVPLYKLGCNMDIEAAKIAYEAMK